MRPLLPQAFQLADGHLIIRRGAPILPIILQEWNGGNVREQASEMLLINQNKGFIGANQTRQLILAARSRRASANRACLGGLHTSAGTPGFGRTANRVSRSMTV